MSGMTLTKGKREAMRRSRRNQRTVFGGYYSARGMTAPSSRPLTKGEETAKTLQAEAADAVRTRKVSLMGRILSRLGF